MLFFGIQRQLVNVGARLDQNALAVAAIPLLGEGAAARRQRRPDRKSAPAPAGRR
jgi:hypothetical protein